MCREAEKNRMGLGVGGTCGGLNYQCPHSVIMENKASSKLLSRASESQRWQCGKRDLGGREGMTNRG